MEKHTTVMKVTITQDKDESFIPSGHSIDGIMSFLRDYYGDEVKVELVSETTE